jgi:ferric-dicitrate binding protein FerR (iron transport regulator)
MPLSQHVEPDTSDARLARVWANVKGRLEAEPPRGPGLRWAVAAGAVAVVLGGALFFAHRDRVAGSALENAALETAGDTLGVTLLDGSTLTLASRTRVNVAGGNAEAVALVVAHGRVSCDVTHRPGRSFVVRASGVEVRVVGTRFSVSDELRADGAHVSVSVERGRGPKLQRMGASVSRGTERKRGRGPGSTGHGCRARRQSRPECCGRAARRERRHPARRARSDSA